MPHIEPIRPGGMPTPRTSNELIAAANSRMISAVGGTIDDGKTGAGFRVDVSAKPVWGEITGPAPDESYPDVDEAPKNHFTWREVYPRDDGVVWKFLDTTGYSDISHGSQFVAEIPSNAAVEINGHNLPAGTVVRLYPSEYLTDHRGHTYRLWFFSFEGLRPFELLQDLFPTGAVSNEGTELTWPDVTPQPTLVKAQANRETEIKAEWIDETHDKVTLYPVHQSGWPAGDQFFSLGIGFGRDSRDFAGGTTGWAKYVPRGTIIGVEASDGGGEPNEFIWRGEWQIVILYAELTAKCIISRGTIQPETLGFVRYAEVSAGDGGSVDTGHDGGDFSRTSLVVLNDMPVPMTDGSIHKLHFDMGLWVWRPGTYLASPHGITIFATGTVDATTDDTWVTVVFNATMSTFGESIDRTGAAVVNSGEVGLVVDVSWNVTARRLIGAAAPDIDSRLEVGLFQAGLLVTGASSEITSSRRNAPGEGANAANHGGGSVLLELDPGDTLQVKVRKRNSTGGDDDWRTVANMSSMTVRTVPSVFLN